MKLKVVAVLLLSIAFLVTPALAQREAVITVERSQAGNPIPIGSIIWYMVCCLEGLNAGSYRNVCAFLLNSLYAYLCCGIPGFFGYLTGYIINIVYSLMSDLIGTGRGYTSD